MRNPKKTNTVEKPIAYQPPQDNVYWVYKRRSKLFLIPVPYVWFLDWKEIEKIKCTNGTDSGCKVDGCGRCPKS